MFCELDVFHIQLQGGLTLPSVVFEVVADAERFAIVDALEEVALLECDTVEGADAQITVTALRHSELQMALSTDRP